MIYKKAAILDLSKIAAFFVSNVLYRPYAGTAGIKPYIVGAGRPARCVLPLSARTWRWRTTRGNGASGTPPPTMHSTIPK